MRHAEIIASLPMLKADQRSEIFQRLCELDEAETPLEDRPTEHEKRALDAALAAYERDKDPGEPWEVVIDRLEAKKRK